MKKPSNSDRKPAEKVKCPYCEHVGSARGLFSHVRLAHQGKSVNTRKEWLKNPYSVEKQAPKKRERLEHRIGAKYAKNSQEELFVDIIVKVANNLLEEYTGIKQIKAAGRIGYIPNNP